MRVGRAWSVRSAVIVGLLFVAAAPAVFAASPFLGRWAIESFGQAEDLVFQFTSDMEMIISVGEESTPPQEYVVDQAKRQLTLPMADGNTIVMRYILQGADGFILYMGDALLEEMVGAFTASLPQGANPLTNEIIQQLQEAVREVFGSNPFMRGTRIKP
jgi:hypothetical protein